MSTLRSSPGAVALAIALPFVFLHAEYQPSYSVGEATLYVSDVAVLALAATALVLGVRHGFEPLRAGRAVWIAAAAFLAVVLAGTLYGPVFGDDYAFFTHLLTAAKLAEYALLAPALPLLLRRAGDLRLPLWSLTLWSCAASAVAVLQFLGFVNEFEGRRPGQREPSFLGIHDLAALSGATLALGLLAIAAGGRDGGVHLHLHLHHLRRLGPVAGIAGAVGVVVAGATAAIAGIAAAAVAAWLLTRRRALALTAVVVVVSTGVVAMRTLDTRPLLDALGIERPHAVATDAEVSWQQRVALGYIGGRIFLDHPLLGVGWQASEDEEHYRPYLADARARFPEVAPIAFPSPEHPWGVQNAYVQAAADLGVLGLAAFLGLFVVALRVAWRAAAAGAVPILWTCVTMGVWIGLGLVAGIPLVGLQWLSLGLAAAAASWAADDA